MLIMHWRTKKKSYGSPGLLVVKVLTSLRARRALIEFEHEGQIVQRWVAPRRLQPIME